MAKFHLIKHYGKYIYRHEDYQEICSGDDCAGQILSLFEFWTTCRMEEIRRVEIYNEQSKKARMPMLPIPDLWLYETVDSIRQGIFGAYGDSYVRRSLKKLVELGFISDRKSKTTFDQTKEYKFNTEFIQMALDQWWNSKKPETIENLDPVKITDEPVNLTQETVKIMDEPVNLEFDHYSLNSPNKHSLLTSAPEPAHPHPSGEREFVFSGRPSNQPVLSDFENQIELEKSNSKAKSSEHLLNNPESSRQTQDPSKGSEDTRAALKKTKTFVEPFGRQRPSAQEIQWAWMPDGEWVTNGALNPEFWTWMAAQWSQQFGCSLHKAKSNVISHFINHPEKLPFKWEEYRVENPVADAPMESCGIDFDSWEQNRHYHLFERDYLKAASLEAFYQKCSWYKAWHCYASRKYPNWNWNSN